MDRLCDLRRRLRGPHHGGLPRPHERPSPHHLAQTALAALPAAGGARPAPDLAHLLTGLLETPFDGPTIVVTHHAPGWGSVAERYRNDRVTAAYASDLSALILATQPTLWVHGITVTLHFTD
ncbi:MAG: hypothetical protein E6614_17045 [Bradyrhizobium sp.]|uniref:hypothetical protein n=1 Tax=Bradyrhizobium TaxID=374 RepID=UPI001FEF5E18|nr:MULTISPECIES: hypothetical protein [unclassified Bradyrhizobium]MDU0953809.1 hypothetical protein [Bradyrhizobium sp.]MDU1493044.1 hypothetical protein [Bradyrhizobium sp.]MDU1543251.1 hypothetical protein [Bradyrhizobium sp.]MDU1668088.1 hypothetical protein [Bradyrhizobium sp.]MDU1691906.1 hypothetical protein [Bradyrhizobium sp.]